MYFALLHRVCRLAMSSQFAYQTNTTMWQKESLLPFVDIGEVGVPLPAALFLDVCLTERCGLQDRNPVKPPQRLD
jgi:hypothetical protein